MAGKYDGLRERLATCEVGTVAFTYAEIDDAVGGLPASARRHRAWWANERQRGHTQAAAWLDARYRVAAVELDSVIFERIAARLAFLQVVRHSGDEDRVTGTLKLADGRVVADEGARWLIEEFDAVLPDGSGIRRVLPSHGEAFLVAVWFSLRGGYTGGTLIDVDGHSLSREEGLLLVNSFAGAGVRPEEERGEPVSRDTVQATDHADVGEGGDSPEQRDAEGKLIAGVARQLGITLQKHRLAIGGAVVEIDGYSLDPPVLVEAWAHQGAVKPAQKNKVMTDALKLAWIERVHFPAGASKALALADDAAVAHFTGSTWMAAALRDLGVRVMVIELPPKVREAIRLAQHRQFR